MKKIIKISLGFITLILIGLYLSSNIILTRVSNYLLDSFAPSIKFGNTEYERPVFNSAQLIGLTTLKWDGIEIKNRGKSDPTGLNRSNDSVRIDEVQVSILDLFRRSFNFSIKGLSGTLKYKENGVGLAGQIVQFEEVNINGPIDLTGVEKTTLSQQIKAIRAELSQILALGMTRHPVSLSGRIKFQFQNREQISRITIEKEVDDYKIILDESDLLKISSYKNGSKLNPAELRVVSRNPFAILSLLQLSDKARDVAKAAHLENSKVSEDAYRHILWSYLVTKTHGLKLAKNITDAHEFEPDEDELKRLGPENVAVFTYQDFINNALGRHYATLGILESDILERVLSDPSIIKDDEVVKRFDAANFQKLKLESEQK